MNNVRIIDCDIPFGSLVTFVIKFNFAVLVAAIVIGLPIMLMVAVINA
jgi:hypothetical protein